MVIQPHGQMRRFSGAAAGLLVVLTLVGCKSLPRVVPDQERRAPPVRLEGSQGPLSAERSRAILERLRA
nr:cardiolipin synthase B [Hydrogenophaga sp.]